MLAKIFIVLTLLAILGSLASGLIFLIRDNGQSTRTAKALTTRIGLSVFLFLMLMLGIYTGVIHPHGIYNTPAAPSTGNTPAPSHN
ncbi:MAG: twin transmembrane helix small protein [Gammaproteobacteria bacterium]|nr:twin transmembrane helix small protein [Gammaproteobacteria bacterium]